MEKMTLGLPNAFKANRSFIELNKENINTLVLGSSQMMNGINAEKLNSLTLNLASTSQHHDTDFKLLKNISPKLENLKTVVLEVSYSHFEFPHNGTRFWKNPLYLKYYNVNMFERSTNFKDKQVFITNMPFFTKNIYKYYIRNNLDYKINKFGFEINNFSGEFKELSYDEDKINLLYKPHINTTENLWAFNKNTKLFFEILTYLKDANLNIIICKAPMYKTYLPLRNKYILKRRDSILEIVLQEYKNIKILNQEEDTINYNVKDYKNSSHLNPDGAKKFTLQLNELINSIE